MIGLLDKKTDNAHRDSLFKRAVVLAPNPRVQSQHRAIVHDSYFDDAQILRLARFLGVSEPEGKTVAEILQTPCRGAKKQAVLRTIRLFAYGFISALTTVRYLHRFCEQRQQRLARWLPNSRAHALFQFAEVFKGQCIRETMSEKSDALSRFNQRRKPSETPSVALAHYADNPQLQAQYHSMFRC